jgi:SAM-dependent methyltransferase
VSGLAVCHADDLAAVFAEFARVLRPGGRFVMSNPHPFTAASGGQAFFAHAGGMPFVRNHPHQVGDDVNALLANDIRLTTVDDIADDASSVATNPAARH